MVNPMFNSLVPRPIWPPTQESSKVVLNPTHHHDIIWIIVRVASLVTLVTLLFLGGFALYLCWKLHKFAPPPPLPPLEVIDLQFDD